MSSRGVVLSGTGGMWRVQRDGGDIVPAVLRGRLKLEGRAEKLAVGDAVRIGAPENSDGAHTIEEILPRRSTLARRAPGGRQAERILASKPEPNERMLDRFLAIAEGSELAASILLNKIDLVDADALRARFDLYERLGYPVYYTSSKRGDGLAHVAAQLQGKMSVLAGPSGVGKSSLMNALYPDLSLRVAEISASVNKGRHTTVGAYMHPLPGGGYVVDTPGLREVGLWGHPAAELDRCFPEFRPLLGQCRFADCAHDSEPDCAVRAATESGAVDAGRYESYLRLREELAEGERAY
jgi:ribosome biogenesis GTPase / thiamine phosphate phosphatase